MTMILIGLLLVAAWYDYSSYRIPNYLVYSGIVVGFILSFLLPIEENGLGVQFALTGFIIGFLIFLPLYFLRAMGAGDIKLMAMVGTFVGPIQLLDIALYVAIAGGVLGLAALFNKGKHCEHTLSYNQLGSSSGDLASKSETKVTSKVAIKLPYGIAIAAGTFFYLSTNL